MLFDWWTTSIVLLRALSRVHNQKFASVPSGHNLSPLFLVSECIYYSSRTESVWFLRILDAFSIPATATYINHHGQSRQSQCSLVDITDHFERYEQGLG